MWTNEANLAGAVVGQCTFAATVKPISAQLRSEYRMIARPALATEFKEDGENWRGRNLVKATESHGWQPWPRQRFFPKTYSTN
jgi:hypothetical protein